MKKFLSLAIVSASILFIAGCSSPVSKINNSENSVTPVSPSALSENNPSDNIIATVTPDLANSSPSSSSDPTIKNLSIVSAESKAEFNLNEVLKGVPTLVVGTSSEITGNIIVHTVNPAKIEIGEIQLDARTLLTDNPMRNNNIAKLILKSNEPQNQFIVFKPTSVVGVPKILTSKQEFPVKILGDLTISGVTKPMTFNGKVTWSDDGILVGSASTDLTYENFGLAIPNFPFFSNVDKVAKIKISLTAK